MLDFIYINYWYLSSSITRYTGVSNRCLRVDNIYDLLKLRDIKNEIVIIPIEKIKHDNYENNLNTIYQLRCLRSDIFYNIVFVKAEPLFPEIDYLFASNRFVGEIATKSEIIIHAEDQLTLSRLSLLGFEVEEFNDDLMYCLFKTRNTHVKTKKARIIGSFIKRMVNI
jgi:hypothetical protein